MGENGREHLQVGGKYKVVDLRVGVHDLSTNSILLDLVVFDADRMLGTDYQFYLCMSLVGESVGATVNTCMFRVQDASEMMKRLI